MIPAESNEESMVVGLVVGLSFGFISGITFSYLVL